MSTNFTRRSFIGAGMAGALALNAGLASSVMGEDKAAQKPSCRIGLNTYTVRDFLKTRDDIARSFEKIRKIGYECLEATSSDAISPAELVQILKDNDLKAVSTHSGWDAVEKDISKVIEVTKLLGSDNLVISSIPEPFRTEEGYKNFAQKLSEAGAKFAEVGITLGYHNHHFEFVRYSGKTGEELLITLSDPKSLAFEIDTYWVQYGGGDPAAWIQKVSGRVPIVHVKDMVTLNNAPTFAEVGEGNLNWPAILKACKSAGVNYCVVEQDTCQRDPFESIALSFTNMKSWGLS